MAPFQAFSPAHRRFGPDSGRSRYAERLDFRDIVILYGEGAASYVEWHQWVTGRGRGLSEAPEYEHYQWLAARRKRPDSAGLKTKNHLRPFGRTRLPSCQPIAGGTRTTRQRFYRTG